MKEHIKILRYQVWGQILAHLQIPKIPWVDHPIVVADFPLPSQWFLSQLVNIKPDIQPYEYDVY